ncbi:MAG: HlyD family efflux transporter periplasmic adaptor subunit [Saprospiraceae bacterium]|nr:HlyD family secretion protein [Bacteroidia bacterium]NNL92991.1 HlyD family efflux transporter periplasmic adaptor subunit [Saprospiraceae bacterium]
MLNITENSISKEIKIEDFRSYSLLRKSRKQKLTLYIISSLLIGIFIFLFLPWTQNIYSKGHITTRLPEQRPQAIQSVIPGRIEKWYVKEGDFVEKGDTIVFLSEIKSEYFDPNLIKRTNDQVNAKSQSIESYKDKAKALESQFIALKQGLKLKKQQINNKIIQWKNKIKMDSIDLVAFKTNFEVAKNQLSRNKELYEKGLKTLSQLQEKELKLQEASAKVTVQENKLLNQRNELINLNIELLSTEREYSDKMAKSRSEKQSAISNQLESVVATSKLENKLSNYSARQKLYYISAPQSGYITKTIKKGFGETIKEGADIAIIVPDKYDLAVEVYVKPQDLPLLSVGNRARLRFDGWPAIVISGWPESSTGIFSGNVVAIDRFISDNGKYRLLISPDNSEKKWPEALRVGTGTNAFILLKNVPIWYEIWRQLNGFPPEYYQNLEKNKPEVKRKAPIKTIK